MAEQRLIDAELLKRTTERLIKEEEQNGFYPKSWDEEVIAFKYLIDSIPTTEAKPVVHAYWKDIGLETKHRFCTKCGGCVTQRESWVYKYCPCCGAQMDEPISCSHEDDEPISRTHENGVKIPVISMEDVPKIMEEKE